MRVTIGAAAIPIFLAFLGGFVGYEFKWAGVAIAVMATAAQLYVLDGRDPRGIRKQYHRADHQ